jgi:hypothetical protein
MLARKKMSQNSLTCADSSSYGCGSCSDMTGNAYEDLFILRNRKFCITVNIACQNKTERGPAYCMHTR